MLPGKIIKVLGFKNYKDKCLWCRKFFFKRHSNQLLERSLPIIDCSVEDRISHPLESASGKQNLPISNGESNNNNNNNDKF